MATRIANDRFVCYGDETRGPRRPGYGPPWVLCQCHHVQCAFHRQKPCCSLLRPLDSHNDVSSHLASSVTNQRGYLSVTTSHLLHQPNLIAHHLSPKMAKGKSANPADAHRKSASPAPHADELVTAPGLTQLSRYMVTRTMQAKRNERGSSRR
jgi:hypothetical protein